MTRTPEQITAEIKSWNTKHVSVLRDLISELNRCRDDLGNAIDPQAFIDMSALPTADIPGDIDTSYPVWAVDRNGYALVGDDATDIETLDEVRGE
ncbi:hypothetical protein KZZ07_19770 [Mameliella sp. CS4]|uniref:hypothetical protein n=1 Tax=Mameliella sp. CS4 TaxID=2862329 RepID=UPI001C5FA6BF|nr:hypothetical protein [Mameliella sp. CS4]MBW4984783.1 hypothetical protein [Mameliella sp. CS4]